MKLFPWHPMMVHFPLALTLVAALFLVCSRLVPKVELKSSLAAAGSWNLMLAGVTVLMTVATGLLAAYHLRLLGPAQHTVSRHVMWAVCTSQLIVLLALWRGIVKKPASPPGWVFLAFLLIACGGLVVTGYYGGENVYHYGLGLHLHQP